MFQTNFCEITLLHNLPINIVCEDDSVFLFKMPTLTDVYDGTTGFFTTFCHLGLDELKEKYPQLVLGKQKIDFILQLFRSNDDTQSVITNFRHSMLKFIPNVKFVDESLYQGDNLITEQIFDIFCEYFNVAMGFKKLQTEPSKKEEELDDWAKRKLACQKEIEKCRNNNKGDNLKLDIVLASVIREFHCSFDEVYNMNLYTIHYLYSLVYKLMRYDVDVVAAGNGLLKKGMIHYTSNEKR